METNNDNVNIEEVTDGTDAGTGLVVDHEGVAEATEVVTEAEEVTEAPGEAVVEAGAEIVTEPNIVELPLCEFEDSENCVWNAQTQGNGEGLSFVDWDGETIYYDYEDVYANDGFIVDCTTMETTHWFEQTVMGFKVEEDGSITMYDLGYETEHYEDVLPTTHDEYMGRCWVPPVDEELPPVEPVPEVVIETPVTVDNVPDELAVTGGVDTLTPILLASVLLVGGAAMLIRNKFKKA